MIAVERTFITALLAVCVLSALPLVKSYQTPNELDTSDLPQYASIQYACWDRNQNNICDPVTEDTNNDGFCSPDDCDDGYIPTPTLDTMRHSTHLTVRLDYAVRMIVMQVYNAYMSMVEFDVRIESTDDVVDSWHVAVEGQSESDTHRINLPPGITSDYIATLEAIDPYSHETIRYTMQTLYGTPTPTPIPRKIQPNRPVNMTPLLWALAPFIPHR